MRFLYSLLLYLALPFVLLRWLWRSYHVKGYRQRLWERLGFIKPFPANQRVIWVHAVSVGEMIAATPLIKALLQQYPNDRLIVTTTTPTGSDQVLKEFKTIVAHSYLPYDAPFAVKRFLRRCHPVLAIIMETELWPNLLHYTHQNKIPILLANARLSERSERGYQRIAPLTQKMLQQLMLVAAQTQLDGDRFVKLGLPPQNLVVTGNIKFDLQLPPTLFENSQKLRETWGDRPTIIAASTHEGEEMIVLEAFKKVRDHFPQAFLILVPRHPDRFAKVAKLCQSAGYQIVKRSTQEKPNASTDILLGDTLGELRLFYAASDIAFVGGSLVPIGGHNLIEPAAIHLPILSGPHLENFIEIRNLLKAANALILVNNAETLANELLTLLQNPKTRKTLGNHAYVVSAANTGALNRHLQCIGKFL